MAYARLDSPLPNMTLSLEGCRACRTRGLGEDNPPLDTSSVDTFPDLSPPVITPIVVPTNTISPLSPIDLTDQGNIPLDSSSAVTSVESMYPATVGTEFVSNGDGTYTNIQTGQSVPFNIAQQITAATAPPSSGATIDTSGTEQGVNLTDPTTGQSYSGTLTASAQALQSAGLLVTAAGKLTAQGQALAQSGQLIAQPSAGGSVSAALSSLSNWFSAQSLMAGVPNVAVLGGLAVGLMVLSSMMSGKKRRRR